MITVQLTGGLGNQMFQYAAAKALALHHKTNLLLDTSSFYREELPELEVPRNFELYNFDGAIDDYTNIVNENFKEKRIEKILPNYKRTVYKEPFYHFDDNFFKSNATVYLKGGWQSYKYFSLYNEIIKSTFKLKESITASFINSADLFSNSVGVHIRRGDYLRKKIILDWHGVMDSSYYKRGFDEIAKRGNIGKVFYFSDDPLWVEKELVPIMPGQIISSANSSGHLEDFYLMQHCSHNIIANSSFSWWAAYLNPNPDKMVVAPQRWFNKANLNTKDLLPAGWIKV
jgi:hypothetical protein